MWELLRIGLFVHSNTAFRAIRTVRAVINPQLLIVILFNVIAINVILTQDCGCSFDLRLELRVHVKVLRVGVNMQHWLGKWIDFSEISGKELQPCGVA